MTFFHVRFLDFRWGEKILLQVRVIVIYNGYKIFFGINSVIFKQLYYESLTYKNRPKFKKKILEIFHCNLLPN